MKIKYFGTAAAEGFPGIFCSCEYCEKAREKGGRNIRTRSQTLINDDLLIDFSADTYLHILNYGLDMRKVKACLITHGHDDHLHSFDFQYRCYGYAYFNNEEDKKPLQIYSSSKTSKLIKDIAEESIERDKKSLNLSILEPFKTYDILDYKITPLKADHDVKMEPIFYIIEKDSKSILYAHDTGYFPDETWEYIENSNKKFNFVSLDCTSTYENNAYRNHMGLAACKDVKDRLLKKNADENTIFYVHHFSHNGRYIYDDLVPVAKEMGFNVSYDSLEVEF